ncbi:MAG TPA: NAD-dependent epimerase/dehydratase family protein, partial [Planctomycetota bacterium]|nr:NAD-dependent epimerase/dehydratase family protein [Planctomycetota bacterium]
MKALVTGGGGFLGGAIVRLLRARGDEVRSFSRGTYPGLAALGVEEARGDLDDPAAVERAVEGRDVVFHVAAKAGVWGPREDYVRANVGGTRHVIEACRRSGVRRLVYTSSPSVVFDGKDMEGVDERVPYPAHFEAPYPETKAAAEALVRAANGPDLATVSLRPHLIWGPRDNHLVPRILARGRAGQLRRIGRENKLIDSVYVDNAAEAHLLAADRLAPGSPVAGKVYFISNGEPLPVWDLVNRILAAGGVAPVTRTIPAGLARAAGFLLEKVHGALGLAGEPRLTRFVARELSTAHWFDISAARRDLGYAPRVSIDE